MPYAHVNRTALYYDIRGDGPALVFVPGLGLSHAVWAPQLEHFGRSHTVIGVDLRGAGRSGRLRGGEKGVLETQAADLLALLDKLEVQEAVFCGSGYGGAVARLAALEQPERCRGLVLADGPGRPLPGRGQALTDRLTTPLYLLPKGWLAAGTERHYARWPLAQRTMQRELKGLRGGELLRARLAFTRLKAPGRPDCALLGVVGDRQGGAREAMRAFVAGVPGATLSVLEDAAEPSNLCQPYAFNAVLERFLRRLG